MREASKRLEFEYAAVLRDRIIERGDMGEGHGAAQTEAEPAPNYDYSQAGYYFITLCTKDKQPLFWAAVR